MSNKIEDVLIRVIPERERATKKEIQDQMIADTFGEVLELNTLVRTLPNELRAALNPSVAELTQSVSVARADIENTSRDVRATFLNEVQGLLAAQNAAVRVTLRESIIVAVQMMREEMAAAREAEHNEAAKAALALSRREPTARMPGAVAALFAAVITLLLVLVGGIAVGFGSGFLAFARSLP